MSGEYERWLIARGNTFSPSAAAIAKLVAKLRAERWLVDPASSDIAALEFQGAREQFAQKTGAYALKKVPNDFGKDREGLFAKIAASTESVPVALDAEWLDHPSRADLNLIWPVRAAKSPLRYPLGRQPDGPARYQFEIHRAVDFVYPISDSIDPLPTECHCGNELSFEWDPDEIVNPFGATAGISTECEECSRTFDPTKVSANITEPFSEAVEDVRGGAAYRFAIKVDCKERFVADAAQAFHPELVSLLENEFGRSFFEVGSLY